MALKAHLDKPAVSAAPAVDARRHPRRALRLETSGTLPEGIEANVTIHNISLAGLLIETDLPLDVGEVLAVDLPEVGPVGAEIVWESGHLFGCAFQQALGEAALAAAQLRGQAPEAVGRKKENALAIGAGDALGVRLNRLRRERGLTLAQVAAQLGVSKPTVWAWEKGKARPIPERLGAIAKALGVDEDVLVDAGSGDEGSLVVDDCRNRIASAYGIQPKNVRIMIEI